MNEWYEWLTAGWINDMNEWLLDEWMTWMNEWIRGKWTMNIKHCVQPLCSKLFKWPLSMFHLCGIFLWKRFHIFTADSLKNNRKPIDKIKKLSKDSWARIQLPLVRVWERTNLRLTGAKKKKTTIEGGGGGYKNVLSWNVRDISC